VFLASAVNISTVGDVAENSAVFTQASSGGGLGLGHGKRSHLGKVNQKLQTNREHWFWRS
jgi:hypothetical protein